MRIVPVIVLCLASPASADPCTGAERTVRSIARKLHALERQSADALVKCGIHGPSPELVTALRDHGKRVVKDEQAVTKWASCEVNPSGLTAEGLITNYESFAGTTFTAALEACGKTVVVSPPDAVCTASDAWLQALAQVMEEASAKAIEATVTCAFEGANDKLLTDLARVMKPRIQKVMKAGPKKVCMRGSFSSQDASEAIGLGAGKRLGLAASMCSAKARKRLGEMKRAGKISQEDVRKELGPLAEAYVETVIGTP